MTQPPADPVDFNRRAWDHRARHGMRFSRPATDAELKDPLAHIDRWAKTEGVAGRQVLCMASGGGRQGPIYAAAGAIVTVVDVSEGQLEVDREVARSRGLQIRTFRASMDDLGCVEDGLFDLVIHPVSTCYVPDLKPVYSEIRRVMRPGGLYISQHKQPVSLQGHVRPGLRGYEILESYYRSGPLGEVRGSLHREEGTLEYLHRWEHLVGLLCKSGFVLEDLSEPRHADDSARPGTFEHRSRYLPPYVRLKARATERPPETAGERPPVILPA